jgi:hypothetical protein
VLTIFWPDWIEALTGYDPDQHAGLVEWLIVIALLSTAPYWSLTARAEWRRPRPAIVKFRLMPLSGVAHRREA